MGNVGKKDFLEAERQTWRRDRRLSALSGMPLPRALATTEAG